MKGIEECVKEKSLFDSNGMSTYLKLFYDKRWGNCVHYMFIYTFLSSYLRFLRMVIWYQVFPSNTNNLQTELFDHW